MRRFCALGAVVLLSSLTTAAQAESAFGERTTDTPKQAIVTDESTSQSDGVYGRIAGDLSLSIGAGGEVDFRSADTRLLALAALRYFAAVGPYVAYREGLGDSENVERILGAGVLVEPLFLYRAVKNLEHGPAFWDLTFDSIGLSAGAFWQQPVSGSFGAESGIEAGLGFGIPCAGTAAGPWLRARGLGRVDAEGTGAGSLWLTLEWLTFLDVGLSAGPELHE